MIKMEKKPLVSVIVITYNHKNYIRQAIQSILNQKVDFKYEVLIGDDASTDGTGKIIEEYAANFSDIIKPYIRETNIGATKNDYLLKCEASGSYIAQLEGDDFWTDENKLQKQVDFLEKNSIYAGCTHCCSVMDELGNISNLSGLDWVNSDCEVYRIKDFERWIMPGHTSSMVYRNIFKRRDCSALYKLNPIVGDRTMALLIALEGKIYCMPEYMSCYRYIVKHKGINWASQSDIGGKRDYEDYCYLLRLEKYAIESFGVFIDIKCRKQELLMNIFSSMKNGNSLEARKWYRAMIRMGKHQIRDAVNCILFNQVQETVRKICYNKVDGTDKYNTWKQFDRTYKEMNKPVIVLFGAGKCCLECISMYGGRLNPTCIIDNDSNKWGKHTNGIIIREPQYLRNFGEKAVTVLITNVKYADNIKRQLDEMNIINYSYIQLEYNRMYYRAYCKWNKI